MLEVALAADDLTGALDSAAPFAQRRLATRVACVLAALEEAFARPCKVVSVNTASRHLAPAEAAGTVAHAYGTLAARRPGLVFKKIDSTLRGNVAVEIASAMTAAGCAEAVVTPATPSQGRTVKDGVVHVRGVPLAETAFVHDAVSPASPLPLADQIAAAAPDVGCAVVDSAPPPPDGRRRVWIADGETTRDLARIAAWAIARSPRPMLVGAAGLAEAAAQALFGPATPVPAPAAVRGPILFVVGSRAEVSERQAECLTDSHLAPAVLSAPEGELDPEPSARVLAGGTRHAIARVPRWPDSRPAHEVAAALGRGVAGVVARTAVGALVMTGGDTAQAVLHGLGRNVIELVGEIQPGVPLCHVDLPNGRLWLVTKAGGFGADDLFVRLPDLLGIR